MIGWLLICLVYIIAFIIALPIIVIIYLTITILYLISTFIDFVIYKIKS